MPSLTELTLAGFAGWLVLDPSALPLLHERYQDVLTALAPHVAVILSYDRTTLIAVAVTGAIIAVLFILFYQVRAEPALSRLPGHSFDKLWMLIPVLFPPLLCRKRYLQ